jgi:hypothetical protein
MHIQSMRRTPKTLRGLGSFATLSPLIQGGPQRPLSKAGYGSKGSQVANGMVGELPFGLFGTPVSGNRRSPVIGSLRRERPHWPRTGPPTDSRERQLDHR